MGSNPASGRAEAAFVSTQSSIYPFLGEVKLSSGRYWHYLGFSGSSVGKESACNVGDLGSISGLEDLLEKEMATHFNILAWEIPPTEDPDTLQVTKVRQDSD